MIIVKSMDYRCPLELKMESHPGPWTGQLSYFHPTKCCAIEETLDGPEKVADAILEAQRVIAGDKDDVRSTLISLHVKASDAPDLTVIDLPGIVHTRKKTQSANIIECINNLLISYMEKEDTIILAVLPANNDLATNAVLEMANKYDPQAQRTIAVITKTDTVYDISMKKKLIETVQDGSLHSIGQYFFVRNRTSEELLSKVSLSMAIKNEADFLQNDSIYNKLPKHFLGIPNLTCALTVRLVDAIKERFPHIENEVNNQLIKTMKDLHALPPSTPDNEVGRIVFYTTAVNEFISKLKPALEHGQAAFYWQSMEKNLAKRFDKLDVTENEALNVFINQNKSSFPTIYSQWRNIYKQFALELRSATENYLIKQKASHQQTLDKMRGSELPTFLNYELFRTLVFQCLALYKPIAEKCFTSMRENLKSMLISYIMEHLRQYAMLQKHITLVATDTLRQIANEAQEKIAFLFSAEETIYTSDERYMDVFKNLGSSGNKTTTANQQQQHLYQTTTVGTTNEEDILKQKSDLVENLFANLNSYLKIVVSRLSDYLPALLMAILHKVFQQKFHQELLSKERSQQVLQYLSKPDPFLRTRENFMKKIESLNHGVELLRKFTNNNLEHFEE